MRSGRCAELKVQRGCGKLPEGLGRKEKVRASRSETFEGHHPLGLSGGGEPDALLMHGQPRQNASKGETLDWRGRCTVNPMTRTRVRPKPAAGTGSGYARHCQPWHADPPWEGLIRVA